MLADGFIGWLLALVNASGCNAVVFLSGAKEPPWAASRAAHPKGTCLGSSKGLSDSVNEPGSG